MFSLCLSVHGGGEAGAGRGTCSLVPGPFPGGRGEGGNPISGPGSLLTDGRVPLYPGLGCGEGVP